MYTCNNPGAKHLYYEENASSSFCWLFSVNATESRVTCDQPQATSKEGRQSTEVFWVINLITLVCRIINRIKAVTLRVCISLQP